MKFLTLILLLIPYTSFAFTEPTLSRPVHDEAKTLSTDDIQLLENVIRIAYDEGKGPQIVVLTVPSLDGEDIKAAAHRVFTTWKIGDAQRDDGVLILWSTGDRKVRIEVGQGLEGSLTDLKSKRILDQKILPRFKQKQFSEGIKAGVAEIIETVTQTGAVQDPKPAPLNEVSGTNSIPRESTPIEINWDAVGAGLVVLMMVWVCILFATETSTFFTNRKKLAAIQKQISIAEKEAGISIQEAYNKYSLKISEMDSEVAEKKRLLSKEVSMQESSPTGKIRKARKELEYLQQKNQLLSKNIRALQNLKEKG